MPGVHGRHIHLLYLCFVGVMFEISCSLHSDLLPGGATVVNCLFVLIIFMQSISPKDFTIAISISIFILY